MRRGEKVAVQEQLQPAKRGVKTCERNSPAVTQGSAEGGERGAPGTGTDSPAAHNEDCGEAAVPLHPMKGPTLEQFM